MIKLSIRQLLFYRIFLLATTTIFLVSLLNSVKSTTNYQKLISSFVISMADGIKYSLKPALLSGQPEIAYDILATVKNNDSIVSVALYDWQGLLFAGFNRTGRPLVSTIIMTSETMATQITTDLKRIHFRDKIMNAGKTIGYLHFVSADNGLQDMVYHDILISAGVFVPVVLMIFFVVRYWLGQTTGPLNRLSAFISKQSAAQDHSARLTGDNNDEFAAIFDYLNHLLQQIEQMNKMLVNHRTQREQQAEEQLSTLLESKRQLEHQVSQLLTTEQENEKAYRSKSGFITAMSQEIHHAMQAIQDSTRQLGEAEFNHHQRHLLHTIGESGKMSMVMINNLFDMEKIETEEVKCIPQKVNLRNVIESMNHHFSVLCEKKGLELVIDLPVYPYEYVEVDELKLQQIIFNLLSNAIKFTYVGYVKLSWRIRYDQKIAKISLWFTDSGIRRDEIEPTYNALEPDAGLSNPQLSDDGVELNMTKMLLKTMYGQINTVNNKEQGRTIKVIIPVRYDSTLSNDYQLRGQFNGLRIALVSDEKQMVPYIVKKLDFWGSECCHYQNGKEILQAMDEQFESPFDLIWFMQKPDDLSLPDMAEKISRHTQAVTLFESLMPPGDTCFIDIFAQKPISTLHLHQQLNAIQSHTVIRAVREPVAESVAEPVAEPPNDSNAYHPELAHLNILLVEDSMTNQRLACSIFEMIQCTFTVARNGVEALAHFQTQNFDLIFMDCQMPVMDGYEATAQIRLIEQQQQLKMTTIIALTAHSEPEELQKCFQLKMNDYLKKPYTIDDFILIMVKWATAEAVIAKPVQAQETTQIEVPPEEAMAASVVTSNGKGSVYHFPDNINEHTVQTLLDLQNQGVPDVLKRVFGAFMGESGGVYDLLCEQFQQGNFEQFKRTAHKYKSLSASIGGDHVAAICKKLESIDPDGKADFSTLMPQLKTENHALCQSVRQMTAQLC